MEMIMRLKDKPNCVRATDKMSMKTNPVGFYDDFKKEKLSA